MSHLYNRQLIGLIIICLLVSATAAAQSSWRGGSKNPEKSLFGKTVGNKKQAKVKESRKVHKARKEQEANQKKIRKDYAKSVEATRKRTYDIQSPEVQARMKQNQKDTEFRDREKKKSAKNNSRKAARKYK